VCGLNSGVAATAVGDMSLYQRGARRDFMNRDRTIVFKISLNLPFPKGENIFMLFCEPLAHVDSRQQSASGILL
jgi:hypothetical protein